MEKKCWKIQGNISVWKVGTMVLWSYWQNVFITVRERSCEKVVFSQVFVILFNGRGSPCDHYPWCLRPHCTTPHSLSHIRPGTPGDLLKPVYLCTPIETTSGSGLWSTYDFQRAVRILLECFLVPCKLTKACYHCDTLCAHVLICAVHNVIQSKIIWPSRLFSYDLILRDCSWAWTFCT